MTLYEIFLLILFLFTLFIGYSVAILFKLGRDEIALRDEMNEAHIRANIRHQSEIDVYKKKTEKHDEEIARPTDGSIKIKNCIAKSTSARGFRT